MKLKTGSHYARQAMRWCLYTTGQAGHRPGLVSGLSGAAESEGYAPLVVAPGRPPEVGSAAEWVLADTFGWRSVLPGRRQYARVVHAAVSRSVGVFVDLNFDKHIWHVPWKMPASLTRFHVVHHADRFDADRPKPSQRAAARLAVRRLRQVKNSGGQVVAHTERAVEILGPDRVLRLGYPVVFERQLPFPPGDTRPGEHILFVGGVRWEKGFDLLLEAAQQVDSRLETHVIGPQDHSLQTRFEQTGAGRIVWQTHFHDRYQLASQYQTCLLVVMPYRDAFSAHGGASSALLEVLAHGVPLLTTPALVPQLPKDYGGAAIAEAADIDALATTLMSALDSIAVLRRRAQIEGPAFVKANHTYERYISTIGSAAG